MTDAKPLTDEDLEDAALMISQGYGRGLVGRAERLVAEVRRLRADGWLEKAAEEIARGEGPGDDGGPIDHDAVAFRASLRPKRAAELVAILKRHRDGEGGSR